MIQNMKRGPFDKVSNRIEAIFSCFVPMYDPDYVNKKWKESLRMRGYDPDNDGLGFDTVTTNDI